MFSVGRKDGWCEFLHNNDANTIGLPLLKIVKVNSSPTTERCALPTHLTASGGAGVGI